jgi:hypothetical protein
MRLSPSARTARVSGVAAALVMLGFAAAFAVARPSGAANPVLTGSFGPGFTIHLNDANGNDVTTLDPGSYTVKPNDTSTIHNFHLTGPGFDQMTSISGTDTTTTWDITVHANETWQFVCDAHAYSGMTGSFTVNSAPSTSTASTSTGTTSTATTTTASSSTATTDTATTSVGSTTNATTTGAPANVPVVTTQGSAPTRTQSKTLAVSAVNAAVKRGAVVVGLRVNHAARARLTLARRAAVLRSASFKLHAGKNTLRLGVPRRHRAGRYTLKIAVSDSAGNRRVVTRALRLRS